MADLESPIDLYYNPGSNYFDEVEEEKEEDYGEEN